MLVIMEERGGNRFRLAAYEIIRKVKRI